MATLTIFVDSQCPLCVKEMRHLMEADWQGKLSLEDIHQQDFIYRFPDIDPEKANQVLHGKLDTGEILTGLDVTYLAWTLVGKGRWVKPLKWRWLRAVLDKAYVLFAKNRYAISYFLTGQRRCKGQCEIIFPESKVQTNSRKSNVIAFTRKDQNKDKSA